MHLSFPEVGNAEHELQDAISPRDYSRVRDADGPTPVLGVRDARKNDAQGDRIQKEANDGLHSDEEGAQVAVIWGRIAIPCAATALSAE